ncbi:TPA: replication initiation factor domain-containing protein [Streptococcus suis]|uniref:replication initiation factor domain-containing protein n=1 Tax=Streptococcus suis TaxID=1307 RepID=UPI00240DC7E9|nr:replication initiation factor domain-containing protein [Streptococcus suis]WFA75372.1 replication initiation factor domain-containing protein [Streptococcus suis]HEM3611583.1 replication initiation factor domain-containing protein [Streptococcus suis]HEM3622027.1 replication initiation factor domain-containing protein [Streptococcus suis]HEM3626457.1 replication initiation factor domain-containing protein [Streptococcus suis]HEM3631002.1 replication initiation factor domain-containing prot
MAKNEHLRGIFDWLQIQFQVSDFTLDEIIEDILLLDKEHFVQDKGNLTYYEYEWQVIFNGIRVYYGGKETSYMLVMSGEALAWYREQVLEPKGISERELLHSLTITYEHFSIRRIDIAIDDFNEKPYFTPSQLLTVCQKKRYFYGKSTYYRIYGDKHTGQTLYLRQPGDDERLRIYDKQMEQAHKQGVNKREIPPWIRTELALRGDKAHYFILDWLSQKLDIMNYTKSYLKEKVKFYSDKDFQTPLRSWQKFLGIVEPVKIVIPKEDIELSQKINWYAYQGAAAVYKAFKFLYDNDLLLDTEQDIFKDLGNIAYPPKLASGLIERARLKNREDLIPQIQDNTKRRT